ncbi:MAG TPA: OstA-like protein [Bacteroidota bacterium]|nr:OstA-like protein [Bacteroidota bacterium]
MNSASLSGRDIERAAKRPSSPGRYVAVLLLLGVLAAVLHAQEKELIVLKHADVLTGRTVNGEDVRELTGNVHLTQGNVLVWCDRAVQYFAQNRVELLGHVRVVRDTVTLTAKHGTYYGDTKKADCEGGVRLETKHVVLLADFGTYYTEEKKAFFHTHVRIIDSTTTIFSDELTYFEKERKSVAVHNVRVDNTGNNITIFGEYLEHFDSTRYTMVTQHPRMMQIDTSSKGVIDTLAVKSILMESYDDSTKRLIVTDSVAMVRGVMSVRCGWARYFTHGDLIELRKEPIVWYEDNQTTGDSITLHLDHGKLRRATILGRTFAMSLSDSAFADRYNQLTGRKIQLYIENDKLKKMEVDVNAISLYFLYDGKDPNGCNKTSGDTITMSFVEGKIDQIRIIKGIEGTYYPENMVAKRPEKYNLDGFLLRTDRPSMKMIFPDLKNL